MSITVEAVWERGVLTPKTRIDLPEKASVNLTIDAPAVKSQAADSLDDETSGWNNLMELVGCIKDGPSDVSVNHDKYLYDDM